MERRFHVAGLEVLLTSPQPDGLRSLTGFYDHYPPRGGEPGLVIDVTTDPAFPLGRRRGPRYPAFERRLIGPREVALSRFDAEGTLRLPADDRDPVRARFVLGNSTNSLEAVIRIGASVAFPRLGALIFHASAVEAGGEALLFCGESGAGKSTISTMLADAYPHVTKVSDELLICAESLPKASPPRFDLHVSPFIGSEGLPHRTSRPISRVYLLRQARQNRADRVPGRDAVRRLLENALAYVAEPETAGRVLAVAAAIAARIPCFELDFEKHPRVGEVIGIA